MEYKGSWNAATNTPTLVNGTGNAGDVYLCEVAGTVNFGAGPITFAVGDQVIYSGAIWQRASGATGTVTSVAVTESGDALTITGSPITTSGTINIGFAGTSGQYINGAGDLTTFPSLTGFVPYTGATQSVNLGIWDLDAANLFSNGLGVYIKKNASGLANAVGYVALSSTTYKLGIAEASSGLTGKSFNFDFAGLTDNTTRNYTLPDLSGTLALLEGTQTFSGLKRFDLGLLLIEGATPSAVGYTGLTGDADGLLITKRVGSTTYTNLLYFNNTTSNTYTFPALSGTMALLEGSQTFSGSKTFSSSIKADSGILLKNGFTIYSNGYTSLGGDTGNLIISSSISGTPYDNEFSFTPSTSNTYTFPNATGTIALTSSLSGYVPYTGATANVNLGTFDLTADVITGATGSFASSGGSDTFAINHSSGSGIALNITKGGNGEGLYINKTSGTGNAATIIGTLNATTLVKSGGTSSQFLKADGSVDSNAYLPLTGGTLTGALSGTSATFSGNLTIDTNTLFVDSTNNRVGILTSSPQAALDLRGQMSIGFNAARTAGTALVLTGATDNTTNVSISTNTFGSGVSLVLGTGGTPNTLTLANTGAATFSSSVTAGNGTFVGDTETLRLYTPINTGYTSLKIMNDLVSTSRMFEIRYYGSGSSVGESAWLGTIGGAPISFSTTNTERLRITAAGASTFTSPSSIIANNQGIRVYSTDSQAADLGGGISFGGNYVGTSTTADFANIKSGKDNSTSGNYAGYLAFSTNAQATGNLERMRITSGGTVDIKANSNNVSGMNALTVRLGSNCDDTSSYGYVLETGGANRCFIYGNGNIVNTNNSYGSISDIKLKENITDATSKLNDLLKVKVKNFNFIGSEEKQLGVIAQELEEIFPSMIDKTEDFEEIEVTDEEGNTITEKKSLGTVTKSVKYSVFVPMLIKAIQEQQAQIEELSNKIVALESK
jgi:hypothetical protein